MKQLSLLMFAILILGCGTETPVVEEPEPVIEEPPPVAMEHEYLIPDDVAPPQIAEGSVLDGDVNVDPEALNRDGIVFELNENLRFYAADILLGEKSLGWSPLDVVELWPFARLIEIMPMADSQLLAHNTEYTIEIYAQDRACNGARIEIRFRTKPK